VRAIIGRQNQWINNAKEVAASNATKVCGFGQRQVVGQPSEKIVATLRETVR
jgi:hypothetical protein